MSFEELLALCDQSPVRVNHPHASTIRDIYQKGYKPWFDSYRRGDRSLDKNLMGMTENGLTEEEAFFILAYSSSCSRWLNGDLWNNGRLSNCKIAFINALESALQKMRPFNGTVFRMDQYASDDDAVRAWFRKNTGKKISVPCFLSTAKEDYENASIVWKIRTLACNSFGKDISNLCQAPNELEVLFRRNAKFEIIGVEKATNYILLNEITDEDIDFPLLGIYYENY